ncbi:MAG: cytochrome c [Alcanivoracaceae bacterium]|nr:cytochrome c [Alcanivoracaceae bacterium]
MNKISIAIIVILLLIIVFGANKYLQCDAVVVAADNDDGRTAISLTSSERNLILQEMRGFLISSQQIIKAVAGGDMADAAVAARKSGRAAQEEAPVALREKLPMQFKKLGLDTHTKFDQLALDAEDMEDSEQTLTQLAELMQNCVACHAAFRLDVEKVD